MKIDKKLGHKHLNFKFKYYRFQKILSIFLKYLSILNIIYPIVY
jgi:hypothetical protein